MSRLFCDLKVNFVGVKVDAVAWFSGGFGGSVFIVWDEGSRSLVSQRFLFTDLSHRDCSSQALAAPWHASPRRWGQFVSRAHLDRGLSWGNFCIKLKFHVCGHLCLRTRLGLQLASQGLVCILYAKTAAINLLAQSAFTEIEGLLCSNFSRFLSRISEQVSWQGLWVRKLHFLSNPAHSCTGKCLAVEMCAQNYPHGVAVAVI